MLKPILLIFFLSATVNIYCQNDNSVNHTDSKGRKQGHWIRRYPDEKIQYDGYFRDDHPVGEFKRYYENQVLKSVLTFSQDGKEAAAVLFYPNGFTASSGSYINRKKEGKWKFFSDIIKDCLVEEDIFSGDLRNGLSLRYYPDSSIAEKVNFVNDIKQGEWTKYYPNGTLLLKSQYRDGKIDGKFETWFESGKPEFSGQYKNDARDGMWTIYNENGSVRYQIHYKDGITSDRQMDLDQARILEEREKNKDQIEDPEKTDVMKKP